MSGGGFGPTCQKKGTKVRKKNFRPRRRPRVGFGGVAPEKILTFWDMKLKFSLEILHFFKLFKKVSPQKLTSENATFFFFFFFFQENKKLAPPKTAADNFFFCGQRKKRSNPLGWTWPKKAENYSHLSEGGFGLADK